MSAHLLLNLCMYFIVHNMYLCVYYQTCQQILQCNGYKANFQHLANHKLRVYPDFNSSVRGSYNIPPIESCSYICARDDGCLAFQYCEECDVQCVTVSFTPLAGVRLSSSTSGVVHELYVKGQYYFNTIITTNYMVINKGYILCYIIFILIKFSFAMLRSNLGQSYRIQNILPFCFICMHTRMCEVCHLLNKL